MVEEDLLVDFLCVYAFILFVYVSVIDGYSSGGDNFWLSAFASASLSGADGRHLLIAVGLASRNECSDARVCVWVGAPVMRFGVVGSSDRSMSDSTSRLVIRVFS